ncbi:MAG: hypothetical protein MK135_17460 [Polyangiaceae bacterium]|nr:hypothetical protein [Polyangiaceae bacterium]
MKALLSAQTLAFCFALSASALTACDKKPPTAEKDGASPELADSAQALAPEGTTPAAAADGSANTQDSQTDSAAVPSADSSTSPALAGQQPKHPQSRSWRPNY